jgi:NADP-dependent 3-hydroxy acid dehydrogenase YdfG
MGGCADIGLKGKFAIVTGIRGIGQANSRALLREGTEVSLIARN